ncbi:unnamed protein product [Brassicogethes aeneus]|uniref:Ornithine decarboxylase antizyme n=1 Tax=Brassicogethes aeneus TaxID=1431903 RepID=A0A9P0B1M2_BRAAE|nr:unnamed protein product [Brassicogethes aeneus]
MIIIDDIFELKPSCRFHESAGRVKCAASVLMTTARRSVRPWVQGLCGGPDATGDKKGEPPLERLTVHTPRQLWDAVLRDHTLYVALPQHVLPDGSRDDFVALLEAAEEKLECQHVVVYVPIAAKATSFDGVDHLMFLHLASVDLTTEHIS